MKVSVPLITYNHEEFIARALDSVLMQKTNFDYEIVVGEDNSTDNTRNILIDYSKRYPDKFRLLLNEKNLGGHKNAAQTFSACKGEYLAMLEGDDYWTSPEKLQKQVDFLDNHPDCILCYHNIEVIYTDGSMKPHLHCAPDEKEFSTVEDLIKINFIPTCSKMFRRDKCVDPPDWVRSLPNGDWPITILIALHGKIGYIDEVMGAYVIHPGGAWYRMRQNPKEWYKADIAVYEQLYIHLGPKYEALVSRQLNDRYLALSEKYADDGELEEAKVYARKCLSRIATERNRLFKLFFRIYLPRSFRLARFVKSKVNLIKDNRHSL
jgi:glycosyltransferase involved in cell wall biosynthesis